MAVVLLTDADFGDARIERELLEANGHTLVVAPDAAPQALAEAGREAVAMLVQYAPVDAALLALLPSVRIVSRYGVGVDNVDLDAAEAAGVCVANVPDYGIDEVALHSVALLLALLRGLVPHTEAMRRGEGALHAAGVLPDPSEIVVGIVGLGRIGRRTAELIAPMVGEVVGFDDAVPAAGWPAAIRRAGSIDELAERSNAISVHVPLTDATRGLLGAPQLGRMREPSYVVNTARAGIVDEVALADALASGRIQGAGLDVLGDGAPSALATHPRVVLTPHSAWLSTGAMRRLREGTVRNVLEWLERGACTSAVVPRAA
jgi:phosphoglycerate dehydrogenase-like enzyme